jgi:hypothetical protein
MKRSSGSRKTAKPFIRDPVTASKGKFEIKKLPMLPQIRCVGHIRLSRPCTPLRAAMPFNCLVVQDYTQVQALNGDWQTTQGKRLTAFREAEPDPVPFTDWLGYTEMAPVAMKAKWSLAHGFTPENCPACFRPDPSDKNYANWHQGGKQ